MQLNHLTQHAQEFFTRHQVPGMAMGIAKDGNTVYTGNFGHRDPERLHPITEDTVFGIASVTKSFAALAIMQLVDRGKLAVTDPVIKWLPEFKTPNPAQTGQITIHHFLTHSSGLPGMAALFRARAGAIRRDPNWQKVSLSYDPFSVEPIRTYQELMQVMAETEYELLGSPGMQLNYSNEGYALLQGIIERASGQPFLTYMQENVLGPLGMTRSTFLCSDLEHMENVTELFAPQIMNGEKSVFHAPVWWDTGELYTNGALKSTVSDLLRYLDIYRTGGVANGHRIVSERSLQLMMTPHMKMPSGRHYGYGLDVNEGYHGHKLIGHGGSIKGVSSHVYVAPDQGLTAVVLTNLTGVPVEQMALTAINAGLGLDLTAKRQQFPEYHLTIEELTRYAGVYKSKEGSSVRLALEEGQLVMVSPGQSLPLRPFAEDGVVTRDESTQIRFLRKETGDIWGLFMGVRVLHKEA